MAVLTIKRGLVTSPNELALPDGALSVADNCVIDSDNIIEPRRGFSEFGNKTDELDSVVKQLMTYKGRIIRHFDSKLSFDSTGNGSFLNFSGSYSELVSKLRIKYFELNSNLYFTTSEGIKKISAKSADDFSIDANYITNAGGVKAIGLEAKLIPNVSGFLPAQSKVAYKLLWARKDANGNIIRGVPSSRHVITNTTSDLNVGEKFTITVQDAGAGIHRVFDSTSSISSGVQITFLAAAVNITDNTIALTSGATDHNYQTNDLVKLVQNGANALPTGLSAGNYYIIRVDTNKIKLKTTTTGTEVDITAAGHSGIIESTTVGKTITIASHGYSDDDEVRLYGELPKELDSDIVYYIVNSTTDTFQLSATSGGSEILLTKKVGTSNIYSGISSNDFFLFDSPTNKFGVWFNVSGQDTSPTNGLLLGRQLVEVPIYKITTKNSISYASKIAEALFSISDVDIAVEAEVVSVTNRDGGDVLDASQGNLNVLHAEISTVYDGTISTGTPANVQIIATVPSEINTKDYFYEVYRTAVVTVQTGLTLNDIDPGEEFQKVYESPVSTNGTIPSDVIFDDISPESFREGGAYLYVNPVTGEGILQANEAPPISHDVAIFKGSAFYANTKERHRLQFNILSVSQYTSGVSKLYIGNSSKMSSYTFVGKNEQLKFSPKKKSETTNGSYFDIMSAQNKIKYRVWFDKGGATVPAQDSCVLKKVILFNYVEDTIQASTDAFIDAFFDVNDFSIVNISHEFNSLSAVNDSTNYITIDSHGFQNGDTVTFSGISPTGITNNDIYYIIDSSPNSFRISLTLSGSPVDITGIEGTSRIAQSTVTILYADNGEADLVVQSSPVTGWADPIVLQEGDGENAANNEVLLSGLASQSLSIEDTARSLERVINKDANSPVNAYYLSGPDDLPGIMLLESRSLVDDAFYIAFNEQYTDMSGNPIAVFEPNLPVVKVVTSISSSSPEAVFYTSPAVHDFSVGQEVYTYIDATLDSIKNPTIIGKKIVSNLPSTTSFKLSGVTSSSYGSFDTAVVFSAEVSSDNSVNPNRVYFSKIYQPEAVPLVNYIDIGARDKKIQRIIALRDSLAVLKEEGVYIISGPSAPNFSVRLCDSSAITFAPDTAVNLNNLVYVLTSQGVVTVSETGIQVMSRNIENKIQEVTTSKFDYKMMSWGLSSESDRCYILWLPEKTTNQYATQAYRYNTFTRAWTRWTKSANCGVVNPANDKMYLGDSSGRPYVLEERKNFERQDHSDREIIKSILPNGVSGTTHLLSSVSELSVGDVMTQIQYLDINKFNRFLKKLDRDRFSSSTEKYITLKAVAGDSLGLKLQMLEDKLLSDGIIVPSTTGSDVAIELANNFNAIVDVLNDPATLNNFKDYKIVEDVLTYEVLITAINPSTNSVTTKFENKFIAGDVSVFKGIQCVVQYAPQHFGKPEATKQIAEGTLIFDQNNFWGGAVAYSSDRSFDFTSIPFSGRGPGYWDGYSWANATFGGEGNEVPVRTLLPIDKSRCRYLHVQFTHINAREQWKLIGVSLEPREVSKRGYR